jgi:cytochrome oxidase Cu insertion factor (SCO1/SenC/PrrC family)
MGKRKLAKPPSKTEKLKVKSHRTTWVIVGVLVVALAGMIAFMLYQGGGSQTPVVGGTAARAGSAAADFTLRLFNGQDLSLASLRGKPVLLSFWASG